MTTIDKHSASAENEPESSSAEDPSTLQVSPSGFDLLNRESLNLEAYADSAGVQTIGYGHTGNVQPGDHITSQQAEQLLKQDAAAAAQTVRDNVSVPLTQGQFDALTSYAHNTGKSDFKDSAVLNKLNAGDHDGALAELKRPDSSGNQGVDESMRQLQQEAEAALFGESLPADEAQTYTVISGDTLWDIAQDHNVSLDALIAANPQIANPDLIFPDQQIQIPSGQEAQKVASAATPSTESPVVAQQYLDPDDYTNADTDYAGAFGDTAQTNYLPGWYQKIRDMPATEEQREKIQQYADQVGQNFVPMDLDG